VSIPWQTDSAYSFSLVAFSINAANGDSSSACISGSFVLSPLRLLCLVHFQPITPLPFLLVFNVVTAWLHLETTVRSPSDAV
jgi:hypothetical protein